MRNTLMVCGLAFCFTSVHAYDNVARVVNIQPRYQTTVEQRCTQQRVERDNSTLGTVIGGVTGGIIGNQVGNGSGRDIATVLGAVVGASVGNRIGEDQRSYEWKEVCTAVPVTVRRGEVVTFSYNGRQFTVTFND